MQESVLYKINKQERESGIELLKIIAIIFIIISHVIQTLRTPNANFTEDYILRFDEASCDFRFLLLAFLQYLGSLGNAIFFVCSAWFLLDSQKFSKKKVLYMLLDVWIISVIILCIFLINGKFSISLKDKIKCLFPTSFALNWYITCYLLFYPLHPSLNIIIKSLSQKQLLLATFVMLFLYCGIDFVLPGLYFPSNLINFIVIYFAVAYIKLYMSRFCNNIRSNILVMLFGIVGWLGLLLLTNFIAVKTGYFKTQLLRWAVTNSPFLLLIAMSTFNIFHRKKFISRGINYFSSLSLLIYVIHENLLVRTYLRPLIFIWLKKRFGYDYIFLLCFSFAAFLFLTSALISSIYKCTLQKIIKSFADRLYILLVKLYSQIMELLLKVN